MWRKKVIRMYNKFALLLQEKHITPYQVSKATGVSQSTLSDWKTGRAKPKADKLLKLAEFFKVPVDYFLADIAERRGTDMELKYLLFQKTAEAVERYAANNKLLGADDVRTKEALAAFKATYRIVAAAELEGEYAVWHDNEKRKIKDGDEDAGQGGLLPAT